MSLDGAIATLKANGSMGSISTQNSTAPAGTVVATAPAGSAAKGTAVGLYLSTGFVPKPPLPTTVKPPTTTSTEPFDDALVRHRQPDQTSADLAQRHRHPDRLSVSPPMPQPVLAPRNLPWRGTFLPRASC